MTSALAGPFLFEMRPKMGKEEWKQIIRGYFGLVPSSEPLSVSMDIGCSEDMTRSIIQELRDEGYLSEDLGWYRRTKP